MRARSVHCEGKEITSSAIVTRSIVHDDGGDVFCCAIGRVESQCGGPGETADKAAVILVIVGIAAASISTCRHYTIVISVLTVTTSTSAVARSTQTYAAINIAATAVVVIREATSSSTCRSHIIFSPTRFPCSLRLGKVFFALIHVIAVPESEHERVHVSV